MVSDITDGKRRIPLYYLQHSQYFILFPIFLVGMYLVTVVYVDSHAVADKTYCQETCFPQDGLLVYENIPRNDDNGTHSTQESI